MEFKEPENLAPAVIENQEQQAPLPQVCNEYRPIGMGDCWQCGRHFHEHQKPPQCLACCLDALIDKPELIDAIVNPELNIFPHTCKAFLAPLPAKEEGDGN